MFFEVYTKEVKKKKQTCAETFLCITLVTFDEEDLLGGYISEQFRTFRAITVAAGQGFTNNLIYLA